MLGRDAAKRWSLRSENLRHLRHLRMKSWARRLRDGEGRLILSKIDASLCHV